MNPGLRVSGFPLLGCGVEPWLKFRPVRQGKANPNCSDDQGHVAINDAVAKEGLLISCRKT